MSSWVKRNLLLVLVLLVYSAFFIFQATKQKNVHVLGANTNLVLFTQPEDGKLPLLDAISTATSEVDVEVYILSDKDIIAALQDIASRGVVVKVMMEQHPFGGGSLNQKTWKQLQQTSVQLHWTNPDYALTHEKTIVVDNKEVFILNQNLTAASFTSNREFDVIDNNPEDVKEVKKIFDADWDRQQTVLTTSHIIASPLNARSVIESLLQQANAEIDVEMEIVNDTEVENILENKAKVVKVQVIIPSLTKVSSNRDDVENLQHAGVEVRTINSPYIHAKLILVDSSKAYIGSVNFSTQSMDENRELGIIITQQDILQTLLNDFDSDWQKALPLN